MIAGWQAWKDETHGAGCELVRHFLARFFDGEATAATAGEWQKVAAGLGAALVSVFIVVVKQYMTRYSYDLLIQAGTSSPAPLYRVWLRGDLLSFIGLAMALTALATLLVWRSLFPAARDCLALAGLPVTARQIFQAKFAALLLLFAAFVVALNLPVALAFAAVTASPWQPNPSGAAMAAANFAALGGACACAFFSLLALQGLLLHLLPGRAFPRVSLFVQSVLFITLLGALPLLAHQPAAAAWWPPVWFLWLWEAVVSGRPGLAGTAALAAAAPAGLAALAYALGYHRYRKLLLEAPRDSTGRQSGTGARLLERWIPDPREQAAFGFIWKTLARSGSHRLILMAYAGIALAWATAAAVDAPPPSLRDEGMYGLAVALAPLAFAMLAAAGLRYVFSLPVALSANWVFQSVDHGGRAAWLAAVERFVVWCAIAPILLAAFPAAAAILGWVRACAVTALAFLAAVLWFEALFRHWRKLPFTCSYLPGRKPVWLTALRYALGIPLLAPLGKLFLYSSTDPTAFAVVFTLLAVAGWRLGRARRARWRECALCYEEVPEAAVMTLDLEPASALTTRGPAADSRPLFHDALVDSRGMLPEAWAEEIAEERRRPALLLETFCEDVRYGARMIRRNPLVSAVVVLTLTVGIGINASVFTVVNGLAFRPHVRKDPESLMRVVLKSRMEDKVRRASYSEYLAFRDRSRTVERLAAYAHFPAFLGEDNSAGAVGMAVSCDFFRVDGLDRALVGRLLTADDCSVSAASAVALISEGVWRARFAADPNIVGRVTEVNNRPVTIVGVVPNGTAGWTRSAGWNRLASVWLPYTAAAYFEPGGNAFAEEHLWLSLAGRLAPGRSRAEAGAELEVLARQQDRLHTGRHTAIVTTNGSWVRELELQLSGQQLMLGAFLMGAFHLVLFISCANVATLLLARAAARRREIAVRLSLGAPRVRLVRMLVTESLLLAGVAGAASLWLAAVLPTPLYALVAGRPPEFPVEPDWRTLLYVGGVATLAGVLSGLAPALQSVKQDLTGALKGAMPFGGAGSSRRLQALLVSAQVAMSMVLLVEAALFGQAENRTLRADPGYSPEKVVVAPLFFPEGSTLQTTAVKLAALTERVKALPGVRSVAFSEGLPLTEKVTLELRPPARPDASQPVDVYSASPQFFETMGVPMVRGREFEVRAEEAAIVSESLARTFWPRQDPIGKVVDLPGGRLTVVGVARDVDPLRFGGSENPALYRPWRPHAIRNILSVRFESGAAMGAPAVRAAIRETDPRLLGMARLMQEWIRQVTEDLWNVVNFILVLGVVATVLAGAGIYGAVSFAVSQRTRELGIRVALGARGSDIVREVFVSGGKPVVQGLLAGLWLSAATAAGLRQTVSGSPLQLDAANPLLYGGAALLLAAAAGAAMLAPARRGARSDPLDALRCE